MFISSSWKANQMSGSKKIKLSDKLSNLNTVGVVSKTPNAYNQFVNASFRMQYIQNKPKR